MYKFKDQATSTTDMVVASFVYGCVVRDIPIVVFVQIG